MSDVASVDTELTNLERMALDAALSGTASWLPPVRGQVPKLKVLSRKYTGYGFFTDFACDGCEPVAEVPATGSSESVPVAWAAHPDIEGGGFGAITFSVFLKDGIIICLEAASTSGWPETEEEITFTP